MDTPMFTGAPKNEEVMQRIMHEPPAEHRFAEAFQSLTMRYLGALDDIKAMRREIEALKDRVKTLEEETEP